MMLIMSNCKACGARIVWIKTPAGKFMPCDSALVDYWLDSVGKDIIVKPNGEVVSCTLKPNGLNTKYPKGRGYVPHWATCPDAKHFSKKE